MKYWHLLFVVLLLKLFITPSSATAQTSSDWYMAGANPQRTSWVASTPENQTEIKGIARPLWYRTIEPYISYKAQIIASNNKLYISSANGLYVLYTGDDGVHSAGSLAWVYPSEFPFDNAPTVYQGVVYVAGLDRKIHALNADTGQVNWIYEASNPEGLPAGFQTNPLVLDNHNSSAIPTGQGKLYAGNRDGYLYAINIQTNPGTLAWQAKLKGPITQSAAYQEGVVYVTTTDSYAYALNAHTGQIIWESAQLPGGGFYSYWPVVYDEYLLLVGSIHYQSGSSALFLPDYHFTSNELQLVFKANGVPYGSPIGPIGTEPGAWVSGTRTLNASLATDYFEAYPHKRTFFVLNRTTGQEFSFDSDNDGRLEYAPILYTGTHSGNRFPPILGTDGVPYIQNNYISDEWIARGGISGWKFGTDIISEVENNRNAVDEPMYYSSGGKMIYWDLTCNREAGGFDITIPYNQSNREWNYYGYNLDTLVPGFDSLFQSRWGDRCGAYGVTGGIYGTHGLGNPPIPYKNKLYIHKSNTIIALSPSNQTVQHLDQLNAPVRPPTAQILPSKNNLKAKLSQEVSKIIAAGHLRPGYLGSGLGEFHLHGAEGYIIEYFNNPSLTYQALLGALPHLDSTLQQELRAYLQQEFSQYPLTTTARIGYKNGAKREAQQTLPEIQTRMNSDGASNGDWLSQWQFPQINFYYLWKYSQEFGNAATFFGQIRNRLENPPADSVLLEQPHIHNSYIAGYIGYLELQKLTGEPESPSVRTTLNRLLTLRSNTFTTQTTTQMLLGSANFSNLVPELSQHLRLNAPEVVRNYITGFSQVSPAWFISRYDATWGEGVIHPPLDSFAQFQARAYILNEPYEELVKYLDVPAFERGDLFYIQNLVAAIEAPSSGEFNPDLNSDTVVDYSDYSLFLPSFNSLFSIFDFNHLVDWFGKVL